MRRRDLIAAAGAGLIAPRALAQTPTAMSPAPVAGPATVNVEVFTAKGNITLTLETAKAPLTTANFLAYVDKKLYDGAVFYRAMRNAWAPKTGLVQGGHPSDYLPPVAHEPTTQTGILHKDGVISLPRNKPGDGGSEFFICCGDLAYLDAKPGAPGDNLGFAAFGHVSAGMDLVRQILAMPTSPTEGEGAMKGQILDPPLTIIGMRRA